MENYYSQNKEGPDIFLSVSWSGKDRHQSLLLKAFKAYLVTDCYSGLNPEDKEEILYDMEQLFHLVEHVDDVILGKKASK